MYNELKNKYALVTGSTSGIGLDIAKVLAKHGCNVIFSGSRDESRIKDVLQEIRTEHPEQTFQYLKVDLSEMSNVKPFFHEALKMANNNLQILVNNAGIQHVCPLHEFSDEQWLRLMNVNLNSCFVLMREFIAFWKNHQKETGQRPWGRIVNISSVHGLVASIHKSAYIATKHGLNGLGKVAALELAADTDITVNSICPGFVLTPLVEKQIEAMRVEKGYKTREETVTAFVGQKQPTGRFSTGEQVGEYCAFLCSNFGSNITGACQSIDGAWSTH